MHYHTGARRNCGLFVAAKTLNHAVPACNDPYVVLFLNLGMQWLKRAFARMNCSKRTTAACGRVRHWTFYPAKPFWQTGKPQPQCQPKVVIFMDIDYTKSMSHGTAKHLTYR